MVVVVMQQVTDNRARRRFELSASGDTAFLLYELTDGALTLIHTAVPTTLRGHHLGDALVEAALQTAHSQGLRVVAVCPFVKAYLRRHPGSLESVAVEDNKAPHEETP